MARTEQSPIPHDEGSTPPSKHLVPGDDGQPVTVNLTPEQARAGLDALDALLKLPSIRPDTSFVDVFEALTEQVPLIEQRTNAIEAVRNRRKSLAIKGGAIFAAATIGFTTLPSIGSGIATFFSESAARSAAAEASRRAAELSRVLGGPGGATSLISKENWRLKYLSEDPNLKYAEVTDKKQSLGYGDRVIIDDKYTGITAAWAQLYSSREMVAQLDVRDTGNNIRPVYLPVTPIEGLDTRVVVFENVADGTQKYFSVRLYGINSVNRTLELKEMQRLPSTETASR